MAPIALVTGASGGIGRATARALGTDHDVVLQYHSDEQSAADVARELDANDSKTLVEQCDITDPEAVERMVDRARTQLGPIDVLVNNAGIMHATDLEQIAISDLKQTLAVNIEGALYCARAVIPDMTGAGAGRIVNVTSTAGTHGSPTDPVYGASKGGLIGLTRSLAKQYTDDGIFTNAVAPGPTDTAMYAEERRPATRERSPIGRLVQPEEVAHVIREFAVTETITNQVLVVDGGLHL